MRTCVFKKKKKDVLQATIEASKQSVFVSECARMVLHAVCMHACAHVWAPTTVVAGRDPHHLKKAVAENRKDLTFQF